MTLYRTDGTPARVYRTDGTEVWGTPDPPEPPEPLTERRFMTRAGVAFGSTAATADAITYTVVLPVMADSRDLQLIYGDGRDEDGAVTIQHVEATVRGSTYPVLFDGAASTNLRSTRRGRDNGPRSLAISDTLEVESGLGEEIVVRTTFAASSTGHPTQRGFAQATGPLAVTGMVRASTPTVLVLGDSIAESQYVLYRPGTLITAGLESAGVPFVNGSITARHFPGGPGPDFNMPTDGFTHVLSELGFNNLHMLYGNGKGWALNAGVPAIRTWAHYASLGVPVWQTTTTPNTSGPWDRLDTQVPATSTPDRIGWNTWLRDGAPILDGAPAPGIPAAVRVGQVGHPLAGVLELADALESSRNSGLWRVDLGVLTPDGSHPNAVGHAHGASYVREWAETLTV